MKTLPIEKKNSPPHLIALLLPGALLTLVALASDSIGLGNSGSGFGTKQWVLLFLGLFGMGGGIYLSTLSPSTRIKWIFCVWSIGVSYLLVEGGASYYAWKNYPLSETLWLYEESDKLIHFDPIKGFLLTPTPTRVTRITRGKPEYVGVYKGNSAGFPDRDDFGPKRKHSGEKRLAVFGDSFSAGQFNALNWPDKAEDLLKIQGTPLTLLNFSQDGIGLGNWWSFVTRILREENYELDGAVFAVYQSDLWRRFTVAEHRGFKRHMTGRVPGWNPMNYPKNLDEARPLFSELPGFIVSSSDFEAYLAGTWPPSVPRPKVPFITTQVRNSLSKIGTEGETYSIGKPLEEGQKNLITEMSDYFKAKKIPVHVFYLGSREELLKKSTVSDYETTKEFAELLKATFIDSRKAFEGLDEKTIRSYFFPVDGHWNQQGADHFASFVTEHLTAGAL